MKVTVTRGIRVVHDGKVYQDGQSADVPDSVAMLWLECGWASESGLRTLPGPRGLASTETRRVKPARKPGGK
jgi:hypothetical protein